MSYTSLKFAFFVAVLAAVYFLFPFKKQKWTVLLAGSYLFYLLAGYRYAFYILITTLTTYLAGIYLDKISVKAKEILAQNKTQWDREQKKAFKNETGKKKRRIVASVLVLNFGILGFLKYYNFFAGSLNDVLGVFGIPFSAPTLQLILPLGISFYTFQSMGYVIDVYREKVKAEKNLAKIALFVSFFPQIIQGPIGLYDDLARQLYEPHDFDFTRFKHSCELILWGVFKKLIIADRAVQVISGATNNYGDYNGTALMLIVLLYALQLYADFSGGIDISRGVAQIFGIQMAENFRRPYFARNISEYWRRWHMSLGAWMRDYVFYPIAMSKLFLNASKAMKKSRFGATQFGAHVAKVLPTSFASLIVFFLVGVWHGDNWKYAAFGLWNGGIIMLSTLLEPVFESWAVGLKIKTASFGFRLFQMARTFLVVAIGYVFDIAPDLLDSLISFKRILLDQNWQVGLAQIRQLPLDAWDYLVLAISSLILLGASIIQERNDGKTIRQMLDEKPFALRLFVILMGIMMIMVFGWYGPGFSAAEFVYMQF
ncbi:MAG: MBOAT family protein [Oscillospiraceae bacterium]|nr:MBOAT family protein [Oscillospiraceae bacterium]